MNKPTFSQRSEAVEGWIRSCKTQAQLGLCREAVDVFLSLRPGDENVTENDVLIVQQNIHVAFSEMEKLVTL